jgi:hypothetical protein
MRASKDIGHLRGRSLMHRNLPAYPSLDVGGMIIGEWKRELYHDGSFLWGLGEYRHVNEVLSSAEWTRGVGPLLIEQGHIGRDAAAGQVEIGRVQVDADGITAQALSHQQGGAGAAEGI